MRWHSVTIMACHVTYPFVMQRRRFLRIRSVVTATARFCTTATTITQHWPFVAHGVYAIGNKLTYVERSVGMNVTCHDYFLLLQLASESWRPDLQLALWIAVVVHNIPCRIALSHWYTACAPMTERYRHHNPCSTVWRGGLFRHETVVAFSIYTYATLALEGSM